MSFQFGPLRCFGMDHPNFERTDTPVGQACIHCREPIADGDEGFINVVIDGGTRCDSGYQPRHYECELRGVYGSVGHQQGECSCFGGEGNGDPPGMTRREAARAAVDRYERARKNDPASGD